MDFYLASVQLVPRLLSADTTALDNDITHVFQTLLGTGTAIGMAVCALFVALAGFQYMTAGGNPRALEGAKQSLFSALIGLAIVFGAHIVATLLDGALASLPQP